MFKHPHLAALLLAVFPLTASCQMSQTASATQPEVTIKMAVGGRFAVGTALNVRQIYDRDSVESALIADNFTTVVAENCMKSEELAPLPGRYDFAMADRFVAFAERYGLTATGHCLIWHSQCPRWFFVGSDGGEVSRQELIERMREYITTVVTHFRGKLVGWDVVNEAILEDGSYRESPFYRIIGPEFIDLAFQFAHEADPDVELYYNDYGMTDPGRRDGVIRLIRRLKEKGLRIDAVGMQSHLGMDYPDLGVYEQTIRMYAAEGVMVMATELDMTVLPMPNPRDFGAAVETNYEYRAALNPYADGLPDSVAQRLNARYLELMNIYMRNSDIIGRVTFWGVRDGDSWKNNWPVRGRRDYPLPINRDGSLKPFVQQLYEQRLEGIR